MKQQNCKLHCDQINQRHRSFIYKKTVQQVKVTVDYLDPPAVIHPMYTWATPVKHLICRWWSWSAHQSTLQRLLWMQECGEVSKEVGLISQDAAQLPEQWHHFLSFPNLFELIQQRDKLLNLARYILQCFTYLSTHSKHLQISALTGCHLCDSWNRPISRAQQVWEWTQTYIYICSFI